LHDDCISIVSEISIGTTVTMVLSLAKDKRLATFIHRDQVAS
jgi:hypothetical protein